MSEKFDIHIIKLPKQEPSISAWEKNLYEIPNEKRLILKLELSKLEACQIVKEIEALGGYAGLIPSLFREPKISIEDATKLAVVELEKINLDRGTNYKLSNDVWTGLFWWRFDVEETREGGSPVIDIDFIEGKVLKWEKIEKFRQLTKCD